MKELEKEMLCILKELKKENEELILKADFEDEGTRFFELCSFKDMILRAGGKLVVKIGGAGAVYDLELCKTVGVDAIMAPMIETCYSLKKFKMAVDRVFGGHVAEFIANIETKTAVENIDKILKEGEGFLKGVTIGRVDLSASLGFKREDIDSVEVLNLTRIVAEKAKEKGLIFSIGGGIGKESFFVLEKIKEFVDRFETRKFIFNFDGDLKRFEKNIKKATEFELLFLKNKSLKYNEMSREDLTRIEILEKRIKN